MQYIILPFIILFSLNSQAEELPFDLFATQTIKNVRLKEVKDTNNACKTDKYTFVSNNFDGKLSVYFYPDFVNTFDLTKKYDKNSIKKFVQDKILLKHKEKYEKKFIWMAEQLIQQPVIEKFKEFIPKNMHPTELIQVKKYQIPDTKNTVCVQFIEKRVRQMYMGIKNFENYAQFNLQMKKLRYESQGDKDKKVEEFLYNRPKTNLCYVDSECYGYQAKFIRQDGLRVYYQNVRRKYDGKTDPAFSSTPKKHFDPYILYSDDRFIRKYNSRVAQNKLKIPPYFLYLEKTIDQLSDEWDKNNQIKSTKKLDKQVDK